MSKVIAALWQSLFVTKILFLELSANIAILFLLCKHLLYFSEQYLHKGAFVLRLNFYRIVLKLLPACDKTLIGWRKNLCRITVWLLFLKVYENGVMRFAVPLVFITFVALLNLW